MNLMCMKLNFKNANKKEIFLIIALIAAMIVLVILSPYLPDGKQRAIKKELRKQGYEVENINFEYVSNLEASSAEIYQSSEPIYYDGQYIDKWVVSHYGTMMLVYYSVKPYSYLPESYVLNPVEVKVTFSMQEFKSVSDSANGQPVEEYIRQIVNDHVINGGQK